MKYIGQYSSPEDIATFDKVRSVEALVDGKQDEITGAATTITENDLTASRALVSNSSGKVAVSAVTSTELGYLDGVTSNVQTQIDGKQGNNDEIQGLRLTGGLNSIGSMTQSVAINPSINGAGFAYKAGAIVKIYYDGYEMPIGEYDINSLFDGRFGTYINFPRPNGNFAWEDSKTYPVGAYVTNGGYWYRALKENSNVTPTGDTTGAWELASHSRKSNYINLDNVLISIDITFPFAIRYENSLSLYWRANYQNSSYVKVEKYDSNLEWFQVYEKSSIDGADTINNIWLSNDPSGAGTQKRMRITLKTQTGTTWCALTQIAITGIVGGIEGTLVNRGGSTMYGDLSPYVNGGASLGTSSTPWNNVHAHKFYGDGSNLTNVDYSKLTNKPTIPTKTSQLDNDSGFITSAPVTSVNTKTGAIVLGASDVGAISTGNISQTLGTSTTKVPSEKAVSDALSSVGSGDMLKSTYDPTGSVATGGGIPDYVKANGGKIDTIKVNGTAQTVTDKAVNITVPTKTSDITNDSGYLTSAPVTSVNSKTGAVVLAASDVGALPADTVIPTVNNATLTIRRNSVDVGSFTANSANDVNIDINVPTDKSDIGLSNVDNVKQYSASNPPPYPVTSVNGHTGAVTISSLPTVTTADNGKFLRVVNGLWAAVAIANANGGSF